MGDIADYYRDLGMVIHQEWAEQYEASLEAKSAKDSDSNRKYYWTMKNGKKINVDDMTEDHLRNVLKMIIRNREDNQPRGDEAHPGGNDLEPFAFDYLWK